MCVCVCVGVCITRRYRIKTAKRRITPTTPRDNPGTSFLTTKVVGRRPPCPWNLHSKWPTPLSNSTISTNYPLIAPQPRELAKNVQLALIGSRQRAFQRAIDEPFTLPLSPQTVAQNAILLFFPENFNFCRKKSGTKFRRVNTSSGNSCSYIVPLSNGQ